VWINRTLTKYAEPLNEPEKCSSRIWPQINAAFFKASGIPYFLVLLIQKLIGRNIEVSSVP
jgi:hypothetical protein